MTPVDDHDARPSALAAAAPWLLWALGLGLVFHPTLASGFARDQILPRDPALVASIFEHTWAWLTGAPHHDDFWSPPIFFPARLVGGYTDTVLGAAPPYWLARACGVPPLVAFQLWMLAATSLGYLAGWLLLRRVLALGPWPAAVGAFLFGFGSTRSVHLTSPQLLACFWGLFALAALGAALNAVTPRADGAAPRPGRGRLWLAVAGLCGAAQAWSAFYPTLFLTVVLLSAALAALCLPAPRARLGALVRAHGVWLLAVAAGTLALVWPLAAGHRAVVDTVGSPSVPKILDRLPDAASWLHTGTLSLFAPLHAALGLEVERDFGGQYANGVGLLTSLLALLGLWGARRRPAAQVTFGATLIVMLVAARWPGGFSPWRFVYHGLPGAEALRFPMRIGMYLGVAAAVGFGFWLQARLRGGRAGVALALVLVPVCLAEQVHEQVSYDARGYGQALERLARRVDRDAAAFYLLTFDDGAPIDAGRDVLTVKPKPSQVLAMWVALTAGHPTLNGSYGRKPPGWNLSGNNLGPLARGGQRTRADVEVDLAAWCARHALDRASVQLLEVPWSELPWTFVPKSDGDADGDEDDG